MELLTNNGWIKNDNPEDYDAGQVFNHPDGLPSVILGYRGYSGVIVVLHSNGDTEHVANNYYSLLGYLIHHRLIGFSSYIGKSEQS